MQFFQVKSREFTVGGSIRPDIKRFDNWSDLKQHCWSNWVIGKMPVNVGTMRETDHYFARFGSEIKQVYHHDWHKWDGVETFATEKHELEKHENGYSAKAKV